jgi:hypothetical protein
VTTPRIDPSSADRDAVAVAHDSRIVRALDRAAAFTSRAWNRSTVRSVIQPRVDAFRALAPRDRISFGATVIAIAAVTHIVLLWL